MKQLTQQIINTSESILNYLSSDNYKNNIVSHDIFSENSPYKQGDYTFGDSINLLKKILNKIILNQENLDTVGYDMRNNINNYLQNIFSWLQSNPINNWSPIISYVQTLYQWLVSYSINVSNDISKENLYKKIKNINIKDEELNEIKKLKDELLLIKSSSNKLDQAKIVIDTALKNEELLNISEKLISLKKYENDLKELKKETDKYIIVSHFSEVKDRYNNIIFGKSFISLTPYTNLKDFFSKKTWMNFLTIVKNSSYFLTTGVIKYLIYSVLFFILNIYIVIKNKEDLSVVLNNSYVELIANGSIRLVCLLPSIFILSIVFNIYKRSFTLLERYEFKSVVAYALSGHLIDLKQHLNKENIEDNKTLNLFINNTMNEIFSNPLDVKEEYDKNNSKDNYVKSLIENVSLIEKIKELLK